MRARQRKRIVTGQMTVTIVIVLEPVGIEDDKA